MTTGGWERLKPQRVRNVDGYDVYSAGRFHVAYEDASGKILVAAERVETGTELSPVAVERQLADGSTETLDEQTRETVLLRVIAGLAAMGETSWLQGTASDPG
jgi:hypothetical protein